MNSGPSTRPSGQPPEGKPPVPETQPSRRPGFAHQHPTGRRGTKRLPGAREPGGSRPWPTGRTALVLFLVVSAGLTWYGRNQRSGRNLETVPVSVYQSGFPLPGMAGFQGGDPFFIEDWPHVEQTAFFCGWEGARVDQNWLLRPYTSFFAALLAPAVGIVLGLQLVNWLAWAVCAWVTWRLARELFADDLTALLAVAFVSVGTGLVFHSGDYSAHPLAFATYYVGVYLLYRTGIPFADQPWKSHLLVGAFLGLASLVYTWNALMLTALYVLVAFRHNRWLRIGAALALSLLPLMLWMNTLRHVLGAAQPLGGEQAGATDLRGAYAELLAKPVSVVAAELWSRLRNVALFDCPPVFLLGVVSFFALARGNAMRWFGLCVLGLPIAGAYLLLSVAWMPGYFLYGTTIWAYCWLARLLAQGLRGRSPLRVATGLVLGVVLLGHAAWSTAHLWGQLGPCKSFIYGFDFGYYSFIHPRPVALSMTGQEPTPVLFGGTTSLGEAGAYVAPPTPVTPGSVSWRRALATQAPLFGVLAFVGVFAVRSLRQRLLVAGVAACLAVGWSALTSTTFRAMPGYVEALGWRWPAYNATVVPALALTPGAELTYRAELSPAFLETLRNATEPGDKLMFCVSMPQYQPPEPGSEAEAAGHTLDVVISANGAPIATTPMRDTYIAVDTEEALTALAGAGHIQVALRSRLEQDAVFASWQRQGLPGRTCTLTPSEGAEAQTPILLPAIELRLVRPDSSIKMVGF